ncbi:MAG: hypothetical protein ACAI34_02160 [Verrucomicrobium sp.]|nr:hypothetical protein [Verrucomicrobium sp.]
MISRHTLTTFAALALATLCSGQEAWVRETDLSSGLIYDIPLTSTGGMFTPPLPISEKGNIFELFARGTAWDTNVYLLDTKLIRAYTPLASFEISTEDSYVRGDPTSANYVKRTRADRPYRLRFKVSGLVSGSSKPAENSVYFAFHGRNCDPQTYSALGQAQYLLHEGNLNNVNFSLYPLYHELNSATRKAGCGEQTFTMVRYAADGVPDTVLAQPTLQVWPVPSATVENVTAGQVFIDKMPSVVFNYQDLYPDSRTYAQIYPGNAVLGKKGTVIGGTERRIGKFYNPDTTLESADVPQTLSITVNALTNYTATDGIYTVEVLTETPFFNRAPERLKVITFEVDRIISSRGKLSTAEPGTPSP